MNAIIKKRWVKALRSGKYQQGYRRLRTNDAGDHFCCLGVLCDLFTKTKAGRAEEAHWGASIQFHTSGEEAARWTLPVAVQEWAGLDVDSPILIPSQSLGAAQVNDSGKYTFKDIARLIERVL